MQVYDFTKPELDMFRELCNFTQDEREYFELRSKGKSNVEILKFAMRSMCRDIEEFIETLYNNTELQDERLTIQNMLSRLSEAL